MSYHLPSIRTVATALIVASIQAQQDECFETRNELKNAVVAYLANNASDTFIATTYGWPIGSWCVENVQDFSGIFEGAIGFNEPLNEWVRDFFFVWLFVYLFVCLLFAHNKCFFRGSTTWSFPHCSCIITIISHLYLY